MAKPDGQTRTRWNVAAAVAGWLFPGLGHFLLGQRRRGVILAISISLLWIGGLTLGGISVIDRKTHPAWFIGQMLVSPSVLVNYYHVRLRAELPGEPQPQTSPNQPPPPYEPSFSHVHEEGTLCTALAGLLNLLAIMDVVYRDPTDPRYQPDDVIRTIAGAAGGSP